MRPLLMLTGGLPIKYQCQVIGGIGMSGAPAPDIEEKCAKDAVAKLAK